MTATIKDICRATGFSTATVSRVLNDSPLVTEPTKKRVQEACQRLDYQPHHAARALKLNRTEMMAVVFPELDTGFYTDVLRGLDEMASEFNLHLLTAFTHGPRDEQDLITRMVRERRADAMILMNLTLPDSFLEQLQQWGLPIVLIDRPMKDDALVSVGIDNRGGASAMTRHLIDLGHRNIVFIAGPTDSYDSEERLITFLNTMQTANLPVPASSIWRGDFTENGGAQLMEEYLGRGTPLPDAIFAANDAMAIGIIRVLRKAGQDVPRDVAIVGFDDMDAARHFDLTTAHVPMRLLGKEAARQAIKLIEKQEQVDRVILPTRLVVRGSCQSTRSIETSKE